MTRIYIKILLYDEPVAQEMLNSADVLMGSWKAVKTDKSFKQGIITSNNTINDHTPEDPLFQINKSEITIKLVIKTN
jgi:hypothetical protein